ncbi:unnamed protein product [Miscanthus lutarioriparius]|uniref:VQ domain-containing protein n=1 Tax=Miscanthus lutarioriparius TaxID=422564 RepID=A0A811SDE5_9POAL|nr:unnamed protein product [Miscanthus lutarioriparius]
MAMSDTGSSFAQWVALYHHHHDATGAVLPDDAAADVLGTTPAAAVASPTSGVSSGGSPTKAAAQQQLRGVKGPRIGKPAAARRRSRASRRAPVTLLNTDTANFRAMVQQFTGIPAPPAGAFGAPAGVPVINFAADYGFPPASSAVMSFDHQLHRSHSHHPAPTLQEQLRRQQQQYTGASSSPFGYGNGGLLQGGGGDVFASHGHGFAASAEDRMLLQSIQAAQMPHMPPVSAANTSTNGFFA